MSAITSDPTVFHGELSMKNAFDGDVDWKVCGLGLVVLAAGYLASPRLASVRRMASPVDR